MSCHSGKKLCASHSPYLRTNPMNRILSGRRSGSLLFACLTVLSLCVAALAAHAQDAPAVSLTQISSDPFTVGPGQHATEVEPHVLANGATLVAAFQTGRIAPGDRKSTRLNSSHLGI